MSVTIMYNNGMRNMSYTMASVISQLCLESQYHHPFVTQLSRTQQPISSFVLGLLARNNVCHLEKNNGL